MGDELDDLAGWLYEKRAPGQLFGTVGSEAAYVRMEISIKTMRSDK